MNSFSKQTPLYTSWSVQLSKAFAIIDTLTGLHLKRREKWRRTCPLAEANEKLHHSSYAPRWFVAVLLKSGSGIIIASKKGQAASWYSYNLVFSTRGPDWIRQSSLAVRHISEGPVPLATFNALLIIRLYKEAAHLHNDSLYKATVRRDRTRLAMKSCGHCEPAQSLILALKVRSFRLF